MARSVIVSNFSGDSKARQQRGKTDEKNIPSETPPAVTRSRTDQNRALEAPLGSQWNDALCCEARNALQVILSGAEILLEDHLGNLLAGQKELLTKMTDNTYYLCQLLSTLLGPEEFKVQEPSEERFTARQDVQVKV